MSKSELSAKVLKQLLQLARWNGVYEYLLELGYTPVKSGAEKQSLKALRDTDTYIVSLYLSDRYCDGGELFTLRSLAIAMDGKELNAIKAREKRLKLLFERLERFQLINFYKDIHNGDRVCWRVEPTSKLINFMKTRL